MAGCGKGVPMMRGPFEIETPPPLPPPGDEYINDHQYIESHIVTVTFAIQFLIT